MTTGAANKEILATFESAVEPQLQDALAKILEGHDDILGITESVRQLLQDIENPEPLESDALELIEALQQQKADLSFDSLQWIFFEVTGQRMTGDNVLEFEPDDPTAYDRDVFRRTVAGSVEGIKAVHRAYHFVLERSADPSGLQYHIEQLATGALTYHGLVNKLLKGPEHQKRLEAIRQSQIQQPDPDPEPASQATEGSLCAEFLRNNAGHSTHYLLAESVSDDSRTNELQYHRANGYGLLHLYPWVDGDYRGVHQFNYTHEKCDYVTAWVNKAREFGIEPCFWMMSDDRFRHFNRGDKGGDLSEVLEHWKEFIDDIVTPCQLKYLVLGLEALEYWTEEQCIYLGGWLKSACPDIQLCFHTLAGDVALLEEDWIDIIAFQQEIDKSAQDLQDNIRILIAQYRKPVIAAEYHRSGETEEARLLGDAAVAAGAIGAWNGCHITGRAPQ